MQCAVCLEVYPDVLDACPRCPDSETHAASVETSAAESPAPPPGREADAPAMTENSNASTQATPAAPGSTLIEFPGVNRNRPAWRKELSERFREIQQRRAREAALEAEAELRLSFNPEAAADFDTANAPKESEATKQLGLVPPPDEPEPNPILVKALRRLERARQQAQPAPPVTRAGASRGHAATAAARVVEERPQEEAERRPAPVQRAAEPAAKPVRAERPERVERPQASEPARATGILVLQQKLAAELKTTTVATAPPQTTTPAPEVAAPPAPKVETKVVETKVEARAETQVESPVVAPPARAAAETTEAAAETATKPPPRKVAGVIDDHWLERRGVELLPQVETNVASEDDRGARWKRLAAGLLDLLVVGVICAGCAAVMELTIGDWSEPLVQGSMAAIVLVVMFLYHTCSVALASRTLGMKLFRLHVVDAGTARVPTTWQCARRAFVYILSLAAFGLGLLYSLVDAEGRTAHDLLSRTVVVKE
jgi:uncharacterized RDD family membrane protein YckC